MSTGQGNITWAHFTGMKSAKKVGDVIVLPITSFSPGVRQMGAGEDDDPMAFVKHHFEGKSTPLAQCSGCISLKLMLTFILRHLEARERTSHWRADLIVS
jgi:hypothetical protein